MLKPDTPTMIDLFAGCGGLSLGLEQAGFFPLFVNELNPDAVETYLLNRDATLPHLRAKYNSRDIKDCIAKEGFFEDLLDGFKRDFGRDFRQNSVDLLTGGPPCQGFSGIGLRRSYSVEKHQLPSNHLYQDMAFFVHKIRPKIFMFENVEGLLRARWTSSGSKGEIFEDVLSTFRGIPGYSVRFRLVYGKDYGVPQNRPRVLVIGVRDDVMQPDDTVQDAVAAGFIPPAIGMYPHLVDLFSDLIDTSFGSGGQTDAYPHEVHNHWQEYLRTDPRTGTVSAKGDPLTEHEYSKHSPHVVARFEHMIKHKGEIPSDLKTKKFAQRLLPKTWGKSVSDPILDLY